MKRKLIYISFAYAIGLLFAELSSNKFALPVIFSGFLIFFVFFKILNKSFKEIILMAVPFVMAFGIYKFYNCYVYETLLKYDDTEGYFSGIIIDTDELSNDKSRYMLDGVINDVIDAKIICYTDSYNCKIGDEMSFNCIFEEIEGNYIFDSKSYYKSDNIFLQARNINELHIKNNENFMLKNILYDYRDKMIHKIRMNMNRESSSFLTAMVFGDKSDMENSSKTILYRSGIGHIMAVSGMHVSICAVFLMMLFRKIRLNKFVSFGILLIFLVMMIIIVGSPLSVMRASIMILILYGAKILRRENDILNSLAIAVLVICMSNPFAINNQGFLLSLSGTYGIGVLAPYMTRDIKSGILKNIFSMFYVSVCVMPLSIMYFDEVSLISPVSNILLIPLCSTCLIIGFIYIISGGFINFLFIAEPLTKAVFFVSNIMGRNSATYISGSSKIVFIFFISLFVIVLSLHIIFKSRKLINILTVFGFVFVILCNYINFQIQEDIFKITFLGEKYNISAVITYRGNTDIVDLSGHYKSPSYVRKYLSENHIVNINNLILSKNQASSLAGYKSSLELIKIKNIMTSEEIFGSSLNYFENEVNIKYTDYCLRYNNDILFVDFDDYSVCISPYIFNEEAETSDIIIFYGKPKKTAISENNSSYIISSDKYNNFTIEFSENSFEIRRI